VTLNIRSRDHLSGQLTPDLGRFQLVQNCCIVLKKSRLGRISRVLLDIVTTRLVTLLDILIPYLKQIDLKTLFWEFFNSIVDFCPNQASANARF
jgi:hypothetical protein